ncbi:unnamed protein product [Urochloa decumbens]|uniref:F-box associated beta-propeller type 3 domain-containing protein n=1 Tax=Urochloa decumbens TaxID=240449 RepID=A0ABC9D313_9POAL
MEINKGGEDEIAEEQEATASTGAPDPKKRKRAAIDGAPGGDVCDDVAGNILARLPARTAVACTALSKRHRCLIRSPEFRSLHLRLAPPLPVPQIAYVATAPIRWRPEHEPVSGYHGFHVAGAAAGLRRNDPIRTVSGGRYLGTSYANTCNGIVLISDVEFSYAPTRCALWNPAVADDAKEVTLWPESNGEYLVLALGYGRSSKTYKLLVCRKKYDRRGSYNYSSNDLYKYSLMIYTLGGGAENPKQLPRLAQLSARQKENINLKSLKALHMDGTIYLLRFDEQGVMAFDVDKETITTIDLPGERPSGELLEMSGRPCMLANDDGGRRTLWRLTVDHQWERRCVIDVESEHYRKDRLRYCLINGVWDCGDVLVMLFIGSPYKLCLYHVPTEKMYKADLPGDLTPDWSDYEVCWGYRPTLVSPRSIVIDKLNQGKESHPNLSVEIMQLLKPVKEQEMRKGREATLNTVCFMELLSYIMHKLPDGMQNMVEMPLIDSEYSISFSEHKVVVDNSDADSDSDTDSDSTSASEPESP